MYILIDMEDVSNYITKINKFDHNIIDFEQIKKDKFIYNIYNNSIKEPFHNFWFLANNCKFIKLYDNKNIVVKIALNNKNDSHNKLVEYMKEIIKFTHSECSKVFPDITYEIPWKKDDNYPIILTLYNKEFLLLDEKNEEIDISKLQYNNNISYSILFEINYFIIKDNNIKFYLSAKLIQVEKKFNLRNGIINIVNNKIEYVKENSKENSKEYKTENSKDKQPINFVLDKEMLLQKRTQLKNISTDLESIKEPKNDQSKIGELFLEQKKLLKVVNKPIEEEEVVVVKKKKKKSKHL